MAVRLLPGLAGALGDGAYNEGVETFFLVELLHIVGEFVVLGQGESRNRDPARRLGNEFVYQMQGWPTSRR
ncbi:MAG: hypothetical protein ACRDOE_25805 [Streptosporangiaceae bacterium]